MQTKKHPCFLDGASTLPQGYVAMYLQIPADLVVKINVSGGLLQIANT